MERQVALDAAAIAFAEITERLQLVAKCDSMPSTQRQLLVCVRDRVYDALMLFRHGEDAEVHADVYLSLFDLLSLVTNCLQGMQTVRNFYLQALIFIGAYREEIRRKEGWKKSGPKPKASPSTGASSAGVKS